MSMEQQKKRDYEIYWPHVILVGAIALVLVLIGVVIGVNIGKNKKYKPVPVTGQGYTWTLQPGAEAQMIYTNFWQFAKASYVLVGDIPNCEFYKIVKEVPRNDFQTDNFYMEDGDNTIIDFTGYIDDKTFDGGAGTDYPLVIGSHSFIDTFEDQLVGKNAGDEVEVNVTFPEDYHATELAGKPAVFKCTVKEIKEKQLPDLDDEFASEVSDFDTMSEYREDVQKKLTSKKEEEAKIAKEEAVLDAVIADAQMEIPDAMLETQQRQLLENFAQRIQAQGITLEQYMQFTGLTAQTMMEQLKPEALKRIQSRLVLEAVAAAEKMEATEEDFEAEVKSMAEAYQMEADKVKELLGEQGAKQVKEDICVRKAADFIVDNAKEAKAAAKKTTKKEKAAEEKPEEA